MGCLVVRCDGSGSVTSVSSNSEALFGLPPSELMGRGFFERVQVADRPAFLKTISDARAGSVTGNAALRWRSSAHVSRGDYAEPVFLWLEMRVPWGRDSVAPGAQLGNDDASAVLLDLTEVKPQEAELDKARAAAEEA